MTVQELVTRWPLSPAFGSAAAVESGESWNGVAGPREWAFLLLSLAGLLWALPPLTWPLYAVTFAAVYAVGVSGLRRSLRLVLVLALLVGFLALERALPRPQVPLVLWSGRTIRAFFLLRAIDFVLTRPRRELSARPAHRVFQFLLFVTFLPCLFAGPVVLFNDFYRAYRPGSFAARSTLLRNLGTIGWGAVKFYALGPLVQRAVENLHLWAYEGGGPAGMGARSLTNLPPATGLTRLRLFFDMPGEILAQKPFVTVKLNGVVLGRFAGAAHVEREYKVTPAQNGALNVLELETTRVLKSGDDPRDLGLQVRYLSWGPD